MKRYNAEEAAARDELTHQQFRTLPYLGPGEENHQAARRLWLARTEVLFLMKNRGDNNGIVAERTESRRHFRVPEGFGRVVGIEKAIAETPSQPTTEPSELISVHDMLTGISEHVAARLSEESARTGQDIVGAIREELFPGTNNVIHFPLRPHPPVEAANRVAF